MLRRDPHTPWYPSYWLAALGAGGLSISFFMYLMWLVPHAGFPMPTWEHLEPVLNGTVTVPAGVRPVAIIAMLLMVALALLHFILVLWNIREQETARATSAYTQLSSSPAQVQLMARPLALSMTVNVCFALGAALVPGLWPVVEYLFPLALAAFVLLGIWSLRIYGNYLSRMLVKGGYRSEEHNHLSALIAVFTFSMLSVGFAAPAAMSHVKAIAAIAGTLSIVFLVFAVVVGVLVLISGLQAMLTHGLQPQATPSIWMLVPILTLLGIEWVRMQHGLSHHFESSIEPASLFVVLTAIFTLQLGVMVLGYRVMQLNGYLKANLTGNEYSPVSFGLICPGVAIFVFGMFWWHLAWVNTGLVTANSFTYWFGIGALASVQLLTVAALIRLSNRLLRHKPVAIASMQ